MSFPSASTSTNIPQAPQSIHLRDVESGTQQPSKSFSSRAKRAFSVGMFPANVSSALKHNRQLGTESMSPSVLSMSRAPSITAQSARDRVTIHPLESVVVAASDEPEPPMNPLQAALEKYRGIKERAVDKQRALEHQKAQAKYYSLCAQLDDKKELLEKNKKTPQADAIKKEIKTLETKVKEAKEDVVYHYLRMHGMDDGINDEKYKNMLTGWRVSGHLYAMSSHLMNFLTAVTSYRTLAKPIQELLKHGAPAISNNWTNFGLQFGFFMITPIVNTVQQLFFVPMQELSRRGFSKRCDELKAPGLPKLRAQLEKNTKELDKLEKKMDSLVRSYPALVDRLTQLLVDRAETEDPLAAQDLEEQAQEVATQLRETDKEISALKDQHLQSLGERATILKDSETALRTQGKDVSETEQAEAQVEAADARLEEVGARMERLASQMEQLEENDEEIPESVCKEFADCYVEAQGLMAKIEELTTKKDIRDKVIKLNEVGQRWQGWNRTVRAWANIIGIAAGAITKNPHILSYIQGMGTIGLAITNQVAAQWDETGKQQAKDGGVLEVTALATRLIKPEKLGDSPDTWTEADLISDLNKVVNGQIAEPIVAAVEQVKEQLSYKIKREEDKIIALNKNKNLRDGGEWRERSALRKKAEKEPLGAEDQKRLAVLEKKWDSIPPDQPATGETVLSNKVKEYGKRVTNLQRLYRDLAHIKANEWLEVSDPTMIILSEAIDAVDGEGFRSIWSRMKTAGRTMVSRAMLASDSIPQIAQRVGGPMQMGILGTATSLSGAQLIKVIEGYVNQYLADGESNFHFPLWARLLMFGSLGVGSSWVAQNYGKLVNWKITLRANARKDPALDHTGFSLKDLGVLLREIGHSIYAVPAGHWENYKASGAVSEAKKQSASFRSKYQIQAAEDSETNTDTETDDEDEDEGEGQPRARSEAHA